MIRLNEKTYQTTQYIINYLLFLTMLQKQQMNFQRFSNPIFGDLTTSQNPQFEPCWQASIQQINQIKGKGLFSSFTNITDYDDIDLKLKDQNQVLIHQLNSTDKFNCVNCLTEKEQDCTTCQGTKEMNGSTNIVKFMEYILEFKMGIKQSYQTYRHKANKNICPLDKISMRSSTPNNISSCRLSLPNNQHKKLDRSVIQQKCNNLKYIHTGFQCDKCQVHPINGSRFHCIVCEDYDLCQKCNNQFGHSHSLKEYKTSAIHNQMSGALSLINRINKMTQITGSSMSQSQHHYKTIIK